MSFQIFTFILLRNCENFFLYSQMADLIKTFGAFLKRIYYRCNFYVDNRDKENGIVKHYYNINFSYVTKCKTNQTNWNFYQKRITI